MTCREARAILAIAPTPQAAAAPTPPQIRAALADSGRVYHLDTWTEKIHAGLRVPHLRQPAPVEEAFGRHSIALLAILDAICAAAAAFHEATVTAFRSHPEHPIITSFPRLGDLTGARLLAEIGDDRTRFADARAIKAYAGAAPVTRASGRSHAVVHRRVKNRCLAAVGYVWAFAAGAARIST
ncbi:Transposase IS116/IS110/IS902 family protein [Streptosporangium subroseum]|uniref:Transposase IS116/IS110/IS902 family protein n=1 Tax=Streptosporangium subroseum TaxID=106412 RepID=A0A239EU26_9ACTN|nr:transposase [Streptosporangium subroseum]SNS47931.1 Transposase IS116/IS110/IS902 family protein [Streptosporangium subroseum]